MALAVTPIVVGVRQISGVRVHLRDSGKVPASLRAEDVMVTLASHVDFNTLMVGADAVSLGLVRPC